MVACQTFAWGPVSTGSIGCRGYRERHVFRVASCPGYQFMRSFKWKPEPVRLQAISEELQQSLTADEFIFDGPCVDCLQSEGDSPVRPRPETLSVHAGEREGRPRVADSLTTPIVQTATYTFRLTERSAIHPRTQMIILCTEPFYHATYPGCKSHKLTCVLSRPSIYSDTW